MSREPSKPDHWSQNRTYNIQLRRPIRALYCGNSNINPGNRETIFLVYSLHQLHRQPLIVDPKFINNVLKKKEKEKKVKYYDYILLQIINLMRIRSIDIHRTRKYINKKTITSTMYALKIFGIQSGF